MDIPPSQRITTPHRFCHRDRLAQHLRGLVGVIVKALLREARPKRTDLGEVSKFPGTHRLCPNQRATGPSDIAHDV